MPRSFCGCSSLTAPWPEHEEWNFQSTKWEYYSNGSSTLCRLRVGAYMARGTSDCVEFDSTRLDPTLKNYPFNRSAHYYCVSMDAWFIAEHAKNMHVLDLPTLYTWHWTDLIRRWINCQEAAQFGNLHLSWLSTSRRRCRPIRTPATDSRLSTARSFRSFLYWPMFHRRQMSSCLPQIIRNSWVGERLAVSLCDDSRECIAALIARALCAVLYDCWSY